MNTSTFKTSTIFVATGRRTRVFRSLDEVPQPLRKKIAETTAGPNARTLIVADRNGREHLVRSLKNAGKPHPRQRPERSRPAADNVVRHWTNAKTYWLEIGLISLLGLASWTLFLWK